MIYSVVKGYLIFQYDFELRAWIFKCPVASHMTETGSSLNGPAAMVKFSDFSSYQVMVE